MSNMHKLLTLAVLLEGAFKYIGVQMREPKKKKMLALECVKQGVRLGV